METINLNLIPTGARPVLHASQYDKGRQFRANLFEGSAVYTLTGAETISIAVRKPDGHVVTEGITNTSDSYVIIETTEQMTACAGDSFAEVKIEEGGDLLGTLNLILAVEQSPEAGGDPSESFIYNLETQIADAVADQYDSNNVIFDNTGTAGHGIGYTVTSEGILTMVNGAIALIPTNLDDLSDVDISGQAQGEALVWDGTKWVNGTVSTVGNLDDLSDVDTTGKQEGDSLRYIGGEWKAKPTTVEMTQAEYDAIVDFTPYENTHIVITDAPNLNPTASDIEYSSGVTVKQAIDSKVNNSITATTDTANGKRLSGGYTQIGNIVFVDINIELLSSTDYTKALQTGLPTPIDNKNVQIIGNNYDTWDYQPNAVLYGFRLASGGVYHNVNSPMASGTKLHIFGSYITA